MLSRLSSGFADFDDIFSAMNQLREYMDRVFEPGGGELRSLAPWAGTWPRVNVIDTGSQLVLTAEVPGLTQDALQLTLDQDVLSISGERKPDVPEGYTLHRQERPALTFSRSFALPCKVEPDKASASVKHGVLTITLEKATEALPRQISVKSN